ncbi:MAG: biotin transporter BioY [Cyanobacteria bacterium P01_H01_bin.74]
MPPKKKYPLSKKLAYPPRLSLNLLLMVGLALAVVIASGFTAIWVYTPSDWFFAQYAAIMQAAELPTIQGMPYTFQLVALIALTTLLGPYCGALLDLAFILTGLFILPIFARGGGIEYMMTPGFGYLLAASGVAWYSSVQFYKVFKREHFYRNAVASPLDHNTEKEKSQTSSISQTIQGTSSHSKNSLMKKMKRKKPAWLCYPSVNLLTFSISMVILLHVAGIAYLLLLMLFNQLDFSAVLGYTLRLTLDTLPYDCLFMIAGLGLVRWGRLLIWPVL